MQQQRGVELRLSTSRPAHARADGDHRRREHGHEYIGKILSKLDELGVAEDTIVLYSTDNGPHFNT
ncbi:hypothetical protein [Sorangium sp. So ce362]|uniref:hypothetical protein n=1 Tax=Sorangium sp. So ce362 TaxID=3133303 RepID=UPI003F6465E0